LLSLCPASGTGAAARAAGWVLCLGCWDGLCCWMRSSLTSFASAANEGLKMRSGICFGPEKHAADNDV